MFFPDSLYLNSSVFSTLAMFICLHFSGWNFSNQVLLQFSRFSKSSCKISLSSPFVMILVSSANRYTSDFIPSGKSLMNSMNNNQSCPCLAHLLSIIVLLYRYFYHFRSFMYLCIRAI